MISLRFIYEATDYPDWGPAHAVSPRAGAGRTVRYKAAISGSHFGPPLMRWEIDPTNV